jgi:hypothetical protein
MYNNSRTNNQFLPGPPPRDNYVPAPPAVSQDNRTFGQKLHADGKVIVPLSDVAELKRLRLLVRAQEEAAELLLFNQRIESIIIETIRSGKMDKELNDRVDLHISNLGLKPMEAQASGSRAKVATSANVATIANDLTKLQKLTDIASKAIRLTITPEVDPSVALVSDLLIECGFPVKPANSMAAIDPILWTEKFFLETLMVRAFLTMEEMKVIHIETFGEPAESAVGATKPTMLVKLAGIFLPVLKREAKDIKV